MSATAIDLRDNLPTAAPGFCSGMNHFGDLPAKFRTLGAFPVVDVETGAIGAIDDAAVFQTRMIVDALRYTTLSLCAAKESGHPGGFSSSADAYAALCMLGHTNIVTEVGHHAPGFYSAMFLDGSLEAMGIRTMTDLQQRFRERGGLLGHLSGAIPGLLAPADPLGQGQHFAMAGAYLHRDKLFPCTIGDDARNAFTRAVLEGMQEAAEAAMGGTLTAFIIKQLKGSGVHTSGAKSHNLYPGDTLETPRRSRRSPRR